MASPLYFHICCHSNVLEKCLIHGSQAEIAGIIEELCEQDRYSYNGGSTFKYSLVLKLSGGINQMRGIQRAWDRGYIKWGNCEGVLGGGGVLLL